MSSSTDLLGRRRPARTRNADVGVGSPDRVLRRALADALPISIGYVPYGLVLGATIAASPLPRLATWAATPMLFAGAAQLALIDLLEAGAAPVVVVATALMVNLRLVMYSGAIAPWFRSARLRTRLGASALVIDPLYTMAVARFPELSSDRERRRYWFALGTALWVVWQVEVSVGVVVGAALPDTIPLDLAAPLTFLAMLMPTLASRPAKAAATTAAVTAVLARGMPFHLGLLIGAVAGIVAGALTARHHEETP